MQVIAPYDAEDCRGLLKAAIRDPDPVVFLENEILYGQSFPVSEKVGWQYAQVAAAWQDSSKRTAVKYCNCHQYYTGGVPAVLHTRLVLL